MTTDQADEMIRLLKEIGLELKLIHDDTTMTNELLAQLCQYGVAIKRN